MNTGSHASASFLRKKHTFRHPVGGPDIGKRKYGSTLDLDQTKISTLPNTTVSMSKPGRSWAQKK
jgi:hypothetical protein